MQLIVEVEGSPPAPLPGGSADLVAFMSFCVSRGFGAVHPLIALADFLHDRHRVPLGPLTTFYSMEMEDAEDRAKADLAWQDAAELQESAQAAATLSGTEEQARALLRRAGAEELPAQLARLATVSAEAAAAGRRVRLLYSD